MSVPVATTTTVLIFMGGVATGIILIVTILLCCRVKSHHKFCLKQRIFSKNLRGPNQQADEELHERSQEIPFNTKEDIYSNEARSRQLREGIQSTSKEVPIINSLKDIIDNDGCSTANLHHCNIVQIHIDSNKTFKFYSHYETSDESGINVTNEQRKKQSLVYSENNTPVAICNSLELFSKEKKFSKNDSRIVGEVKNARRILFKSQEHIAQSVSLANTLNLSASLLKSNAKVVRSMPNVAVNFNAPLKSKNLSITSEDRKDPRSRRISFRKKLHNLKKYIDDSIVENICNESFHKCDEIKTEESCKNKESKQINNVQEMSKELWQLRAMLADADELESDDSSPSTPKIDNASSTSGIHSFHSSSESRRNEHFRDLSRSRKIFPLEILNNGMPKFSEETQFSIKELQFDDTLNPEKDAKIESTIQKKTSVRRQIYRNTIAKQQQKIFNQDFQPSEDFSTIEFKPESCLTSGETESIGQPSCESFNVEDICSSADAHNNRLERLRGDSGYKSLENQQSLRTSFQLIQESNITSEDESILQPRILVPLSSTTQILTRRVHSADENLVTIPISFVSVADETIKGSGKSAKVPQKNNSTDDNLSEERRDQYRNIHKSSQNIGFFSQSRCRSQLATSSDIASIVKPIFCNTSLLSSTSSFASSLFSRFLKSQSRRAYTRTQRDYSIDERSDAIFNEFLRFDPTLEMRHNHCLSRTSPRSHQRLQRYKFSGKYSPTPLISKNPDNATREEKIKVSKQRHLKSINNTTFSENRVENDLEQINVETHMPRSCEINLESEEDASKIIKQTSLKHIPIIQLTEEE